MAMSLLVRMFVGALAVQVAAGLGSPMSKAKVQHISLDGKAMSTTDPIAMLEDVKQMAHSGQTVPAATAKTIKDLVEEIRATLIETRNAANKEIQLMKEDPVKCNNVLNLAKTGSIQAATESIAGFRTSHSDCRKAQVALPKTECEHLTTFFGDINPTIGLPNEDNWKARYGDIPFSANELRLKQVDYVGEVSTKSTDDDTLSNMCNIGLAKDLNFKCTTELEDITEKQEECGEKQVKFEASVCTWKNGLDTACSDFDTCHVKADSDYEAHMALKAPLVPRWGKEYVALAKIECFCNVWSNTSEDKGNLTGGDVLATCDGLDVTEEAAEKIDIDFGKLDAGTRGECTPATKGQYPEEACEGKPCPGGGGFAATEYTDAKVGKDAKVGGGSLFVAFGCTSTNGLHTLEATTAAPTTTQVVCNGCIGCFLDGKCWSPTSERTQKYCEGPVVRGLWCEATTATPTTTQAATGCHPATPQDHRQCDTTPGSSNMVWAAVACPKISSQSRCSDQCCVWQAGLLIQSSPSNSSAAPKALAQLFELHADGSMHKEPTHTQSSHHKRSLIRQEAKSHAHLDTQGQVANVEAHTVNEASSSDLDDSMHVNDLLDKMNELMGLMKSPSVKAALAKSIGNMQGAL